MTGCLPPPQNHFGGATSFLVGVCLTISTNYITLLARNLNGRSGQIRIFRIWQHQTEYLLSKAGYAAHVLSELSTTGTIATAIIYEMTGEEKATSVAVNERGRDVSLPIILQ
jgi:hypothetical protein